MSLGRIAIAEEDATVDRRRRYCSLGGSILCAVIMDL